MGLTFIPVGAETPFAHRVVLHVSVTVLQTEDSPLSSSAMAFKPSHFFAVALAGWLNREQQDVITYLREKLGTKRLHMA